MGKPTAGSTGKKPKRDLWAIRITFITFGLSAGMSFFSESALETADFGVAILLLSVLVVLGVVADMIGVAVTAADETPFISMAAKRVKGAKQCVWLIRRAERVSNILNDVVGDVSSIISGAAGVVVAARLGGVLGLSGPVAAVLVSAMIAACMVGGKAWGKKVAMSNPRDFLYFVGYLITPFVRLESKKPGKPARRKGRQRGG